MGGDSMTIDDTPYLGELGLGGMTVEDIMRLRSESYRAQIREYLLAWLAARHGGSHQRSY